MGVSVPLNLILHKNQRSIHDSRALNKVVKAGKRFGKTKWLLYALVQACGLKKNQVIWYLAPSYRQAENIAWATLNWLLPPHIVKRSQENKLTKEFINGSILKLVGCENEDSVRGIKLDGAGFDEASYIDPYVYDAIIKGQLMGNKNEGQGFAYFISSPNKSGRNWFSSFWEEAKMRQDQGSREWGAWYFSIYDNPTLSKEEIDKIKESTPDDTWNLEYMALESEHAGQKYSEFRIDKHVGELPYKEALPTYRSVDWGLDHPTVVLWARVSLIDQVVYVYDEFVKNGLLINEIVKVMNEKTAEGRIEWTVIDPSANRRDQSTGKSVKDEFLRCGIGCVDGDRRDRGTDITKMFFKKGAIKIHPRCKNLILELKNLQWGDKVSDDCTDALRYMLVRIHDLVFNGRIERDSITESPKVSTPGTFNLNDPYLFPKTSRAANNLSFIYDEVE